MNLRTKLLCGLAAVVTSILAAHAQVPGVNSTLDSVFTLAYDNSTMKQTFSATSPVFSPLGTGAAGDVCTLTGSATKNIRVRRLIFSGYSNAVMADPVSVIKRSTATADLAGTGTPNSSLITIVPHDASNSAATAVAEYWTGNGANGTAVGVLIDVLYWFGNATTGIGGPAMTIEFAREQPIVLRSAAQEVAVNLNPFVSTAAKITCTWQWTEE